MATLQSLPPELFYKILDELPRHWVAMLSRVNRQFNKHVEPVLFRSIDWKFSNPNEADVAVSFTPEEWLSWEYLYHLSEAETQPILKSLILKRIYIWFA